MKDFKYSLTTTFSDGYKFNLNYRTKREVESAFRRSYTRDNKQYGAILKNMGWYQFREYTEFGHIDCDVFISRNW